MEKIIKDVSLANKYQFKSFDVFQTSEVKRPRYTEDTDTSQHGSNGDASNASSSFGESQTPNNNHTSASDLKAQEAANAHQNELIENLLKKIDELSTNMVKMEMQMERQQDDFNARLADERANAKELGASEAKTQFEAQYSAQISNNDKMISASVKKLDEASLAFTTKFSEIEKDLTQTALHLASEVIKQEVSKRSAQIAANLVSELIVKLKDASNITIKVNADDLNAVQASLEPNSKLTIEADEAVSKGGVIILSDVGNLDGQLSARFEKIKQEAFS